MSYRIHIGPNIRKSPYFEATVAAGVQSFSVYNHMYIPGNFGNPQAEYDRLLNGVSMWDVAAQRQVALQGPDAGKLAQLLTPRNIASTKIGQGRYVPICDHEGLLINDPVLLKLADDHYWLSIADSDLVLWAEAIARERGLHVRVYEPDVSPLAIQGPKAVDVTADLFGDWIRDLRYFWFRDTFLDDIPVLVARSGWSKQGGYELYLKDARRGNELWDKVRAAGTAYGIGPGAPNDVERLESGLISYGADMRRQTHPATPFEMGFGGMIHLQSDHEFIGREALTRLAAQPVPRRRCGVFLDGDPVAGNEHPTEMRLAGQVVGIISEITFSKRLNRNIGVGLIGNDIGQDCEGMTIELADGPRGLTLTDLPFIA